MNKYEKLKKKKKPSSTDRKINPKTCNCQLSRKFFELPTWGFHKIKIERDQRLTKYRIMIEKIENLNRESNLGLYIFTNLKLRASATMKSVSEMQ